MSGVRRMLRKWLCLLLTVGYVFFAAVCGAEESCPLLGDWAFDYEPEVSVLTVNSDGTAVWKSCGTMRTTRTANGRT